MPKTSEDVLEKFMKMTGLSRDKAEKELAKSSNSKWPDDMLVVAADNLLFFSFKGFVDFAKEKGTPCIMCHQQLVREKLQRTGVVVLDENNMVLNMEEKPQEPKSTWAVPPFYIYKKENIDMIMHAIENGCGFDAPGNLAHYPRGNDETTHVNWCDLTIINENTLEEIFYNSYITNFFITESNVESIVRDGRSRWSVENGNYNILKNHGYHGEHNFGHGDNYLSSFLFTLNLLAFVFHTILELADPTFQNALKRRVTHKNLFQHLQSITEWMVFDSWDIVFALISIPKDQKISASKFIEFLHSC